MTPDARLLLATMEMEMSARRRRRGAAPIQRAGRVLLAMAILNVIIGLVLFSMPRPVPEDLDAVAAAIASLVTAAVLFGLGLGALKGIRACVWIGAALYGLDIVVALASSVFAGVFVKVIVLMALGKNASAMLEEEDGSAG
jgi:peptidoglycan/LPS O-acetylase OafA/YrhL